MQEAVFHVLRNFSICFITAELKLHNSANSAAIPCYLLSDYTLLHCIDFFSLWPELKMRLQGKMQYISTLHLPSYCCFKHIYIAYIHTQPVSACSSY